ncbi:MAG: hypothetical protein ACOYVD_14415 [Bacillota bacterium]
MKNAAIFCFISAIIIYAVTIISPFFLGEAIAFYLLRLAFVIFDIGVILGLIHVFNERRQEKKKEYWDEWKDY